MKTTKLITALFASAGLAFAAGAGAQVGTKEVRDMSIKKAEAQYKIDKAACDALSGNAKDVCVEEAKGKEKIAKAEAEAAYQGTPKSRENVRIARADAAYEVAKEKCDDLAGNPKDVCVKEAKAAHTKATADAKVDRVASETRRDATDRVANAQRDAMRDKVDADYRVAIEKCDALAGAAKDACVRDAKLKYGKS
jgi:hypothetical protein